MRTHAISIGVGVLSIILALTLPLHLIWIAGFVYILQGTLHAVNGRLIGRARVRAFPPSVAV